jgi:RHS repeat-associated protein
VTVVVEPGLADTGFHVFDGWRQVAQHTLHVSGSSFYAVPTKQFVWGARLDEMLAYRRRVVVSSVVSWEVYYVLHGGQDTAAKLVDAGGVVRERYEYDPYGMVKVYSGAGSYLGGTSPLGLAFLWKAVRLDAETGLLYMRNRYYSTGLGRFLTRDPIGVWGDYVNVGNAYSYCGCRPLTHGDAFGLQADVGGIVGFSSSGGVAYVHFNDGVIVPLPSADAGIGSEGSSGGLSSLFYASAAVGVMGLPLWPKPFTLPGASKGCSTWRKLQQVCCIPKSPMVPGWVPCGPTSLFNWCGRIVSRAGWVGVCYELCVCYYDNWDPGEFDPEYYGAGHPDYKAGHPDPNSITSLEPHYGAGHPWGMW